MRLSLDCPLSVCQSFWKHRESVCGPQINRMPHFPQAQACLHTSCLHRACSVPLSTETQRCRLGAPRLETECQCCRVGILSVPGPFHPLVSEIGCFSTIVLSSWWRPWSCSMFCGPDSVAASASGFTAWVIGPVPVPLWHWLSLLCVKKAESHVLFDVFSWLKKDSTDVGVASPALSLSCLPFCVHSLCSLRQFWLWAKPSRQGPACWYYG